jgi:hypothetical protein
MEEHEALSGRAPFSRASCRRGPLARSLWIRHWTSASTRTRPGRSARASPRGPSTRSPRRPTAISGWARSSACFASTASGTSLCRRRPITSSHPPRSRACSPRATVPSGSVPGTGCPGGRTASSRTTRSLPGRASLGFSRIAKARCGWARSHLPRAGSARFGTPNSSATGRTGLSAPGCSACTRTPRAVSG